VTKNAARLFLNLYPDFRKFDYAGESIFSSETACFVANNFYENLSKVTSEILEDKFISLLSNEECKKAAMDSLAAMKSQKVFLN
jgi:hypothetical protein